MAPLAAALPYLYAAGAAMAAYGAYSSAQAQSANAKSQQKAADYNATVNKQNAMSAEAAGAARELAIRRNNDQILGRERASIGESGGGFTGTNVGLLTQNATNLELNALDTRYNADMSARGMLSDANMNQFEGDVAGMNAKSYNTASYVGAASSALGSVSNYNSARYLGGGG